MFFRIRFKFDYQKYFYNKQVKKVKYLVIFLNIQEKI